MDVRSVRPVIVRAHLLDRRGSQMTGKMTYAFLILDEDGEILERPFASRSLAEICKFVLRYKKQHGLPRVKFDPPEGVDGNAGKNPRQYEALELLEIYYASPALEQS